MKKIYLTLLMILVAVSNIGCSSVDKDQGGTKTISKSNDSANNSNKEEANKILGQMYNQYATIAGGWYLNQKCAVLDKDKAKEFEWYVVQVNVFMQKLTKNINMLRSIQQGAIKAVDEKYSDCSQKSKNIVNDTFDLAKKMNLALTNKPYDKENSDKEYLLSRYKSIANWMYYSDHCKSISKDIVSDVASVVKKIKTKISSKHPKEVSAISMQVMDNKKDLEKVNCSKVKSLNPNMLSEIRFVQRSLGIK